jgi:hypothetical protein
MRGRSDVEGSRAANRRRHGGRQVLSGYAQSSNESASEMPEGKFFGKPASTRRVMPKGMLFRTMLQDSFGNAF